MNEQTEKLIRELTDKLGTTAEHLWGVLIRQAGISGTINLLVCAAWCALLVWGYRLVRRKTTKPPKTKDNEWPHSEWDGDGAGLAWAIWGIATVVTTLVIGCNLEYITGALLNPEYWALKQVVR